MQPNAHAAPTVKQKHLLAVLCKNHFYLNQPENINAISICPVYIYKRGIIVAADGSSNLQVFQPAMVKRLLKALNYCGNFGKPQEHSFVLQGEYNNLPLLSISFDYGVMATQTYNLYIYRSKAHKKNYMEVTSLNSDFESIRISMPPSALPHLMRLIRLCINQANQSVNGYEIIQPQLQ